MSTRRTFLLSMAAAGAGAAAAAQGVTDRKGELRAIAAGQVKLLPGLFLERARLNREYMASLKSENLLQNFYMEAGMWSPTFRMTGSGSPSRGDDIHWGWESPTCQLRGHFLGHWLSAASYIGAINGDAELKGKADRVVSELARVQKANGGQWAGSIPEKYLDWVAQKKPVWAPHYTIHKTFMGLVDAYNIGRNEQALDIAGKFAQWFHDWSGKFTREQFNDILDVETGGMLEVWADLYGITSKPMYRDLMDRYNRPRLFDRLVAGKDPLTNKHANTTIPEAQGAARAFEVTGDSHWRDIALAYWRSAVTTRGMYATGGQTSGEIWTPPMKLAARLGDKNQEHCVVYNMIRLADYLFRWTGDVQYGDYIERNLYNGVLAQQHPQTGMVTYFLPMAPGSKKTWGSPTNDFWCCHGSLVQAQSRHERHIYYENAAGVVVAQYIPSEATLRIRDTPVRVTQTMVNEGDDHRVHLAEDPPDRPNRWIVQMRVKAERPTDFELKLRVPWWVQGKAAVVVNGQEQRVDSAASTFVSLRRSWSDDEIRLVLPKGLWTSPLPDRPDTVAFLDGPVVLAGLTAEQTALTGDAKHLDKLLAADNEREWGRWLGGYQTIEQSKGLRFVPLHTITDQPYTIYFPLHGS